MSVLTSHPCLKMRGKTTANMDSLSRKLFLLVHLLLLEILVFTRTVGVTHWKLQENTIVPASAAAPHPSSTTEGEADEFLWSSVSGEDPEFSVLMKRTTGSNSHGGLGTVAGGAGSSGTRNCRRNSCSRGQHQASSCSSKAGDSDSGPSGLGKCSEKPAAKPHTPRNPDGSGPMSVHISVIKTAYNWHGKQGTVICIHPLNFSNVGMSYFVEVVLVENALYCNRKLSSGTSKCPYMQDV